ncbi:MAG TPA: hypothetical protein VJ505_02550 [Holophagaceae bacterium]|nr:hypothetical protein [Holophagaceae bacterium]
MRRLALLLGATLAAQAQDTPPKLPFAPALYSIRATGESGSSLVLLDEGGKELTIAEDPRSAGGGGLLSSKPFYASFFGAFSTTPGFGEVIYTRYGKPDPPSTNGGFIKIGNLAADRSWVGKAIFQPEFGEHNLQGIYRWVRATGKTEILWTSNQLESQLEAWLKTPDGAPFKEAHIDDELSANRSTYLFHLEGGRFAWVTGDSIIELDIHSKKARFLFSDTAREKHSLGAKMWLGASEKSAQSTAWQEADGTICVIRPGIRIRLHPNGTYDADPLAEGHRIVNLAKGIIATTNGDDLHLSAMGSKPFSDLHLENNLLQSSADGQALFLYTHYATAEDLLSRVSLDGRVIWKHSLGDCRFGFLLVEQGNQLRVLVRRTQANQVVRITLNAETGAEEALEPWTQDSAYGPGKNGEFRAPIELADTSVLISTQSGYLVWTPSQGDVKPLPRTGWSRPGKELTGVGSEENAFGIWSWMDNEMRLRPIFQSPLVDQMLVQVEGRVLPICNWVNNGSTLASNPRSRGQSSQKKGFPFFQRDFGIIQSPLLLGWAQLWVQQVSRVAQIEEPKLSPR